MAAYTTKPDNGKAVPGPSELQVPPTPENTKTLQLRPYQEPCVESVLDVWKYGLPAIITAQTGAGKTYMGVEAASRWNADYVIVVGPKASLTKWSEVLLAKFSPSNIFTVTSDAWIRCGTPEAPNNRQPYTHKYERNGTGYDFYPSQLWIDLCTNYRVIFILDEFHMYQKPSQRTFAVSACSRFILLHENNSRVLCLSHTPSDDMAYIPIHMYLLGMICQEERSDGKTDNPSKAMLEWSHIDGTYNLTGLEDVMKYVEDLGYEIKNVREEASLLKYEKGRGVHNKANSIAGELFLNYVRDKLAFSCTPSFLEDEELKPLYENIFCRTTGDTLQKIFTILAGGYEPEEIPIVFEHKYQNESSKSGLAVITKMQQEMEKIKEMIYVEQAVEHLTDEPSGKVVIMVQFLNSLDYIFTDMKKRGYNPVKLEGCMDQKSRDSSIAAFQSHNLDCRVIVGTLYTGGVSIDLHDTSLSGKFPRMMLIPPALRVKDMVQAAGRVFRDGVTSKSTVRILYTADGDKQSSPESRFYQKVWKKTSTIKRYHATDQEAILPCDYNTYLTEKTYMTYVDSDYIKVKN